MFIEQCETTNAAHNYTNPGLVWEPILGITGTKLHLLSDVDSHLLIEERICENMSVSSVIDLQQQMFKTI